jgi:hypothetical protein
MFNYFKKSVVNETKTEVQNVNGVCFSATNCDHLLKSFYTKIMLECADRASLPESVAKDAYTLTCYDSYSPAKLGLISLIVEAMINSKRTFYEKEKGKNGAYTFNEIEIKGDALDSIDPNVLELDFRSWHESDILCLLFKLLGGILSAMGNGVTISQAMLIKIHKLSEMISNAQNTEPLKEQLGQLNDSISQGRAGYIDAESAIEFASYDPSNSEKAASFVFQMISTVTGVPASYVSGEVVTGLGDSSGGDEKRLDVALRTYFNGILAGCLYSVFDRTFQYKTTITDVPAMVELFTWLETTSMITEEAKQKLLIDNTVLLAGDMAPITVPKNPIVVV